MKVTLQSVLLTLFILLLSSANLLAQKKDDIWVNLDVTTPPTIKIKLGYWRYRNLGTQQFTIKITNQSNKNIRVKGQLIAVLTCGNEVSAGQFEEVIKPGESEGGENYLFASNAMTGATTKEDCIGNPVTYYEDIDPKKPWHSYNNISTLKLGSYTYTFEPTEAERKQQEEADAKKEKQQDEEKQRQAAAETQRKQQIQQQTEANNQYKQQIEINRQKQLTNLNEQNRRQAQSFQALGDGINGVFDMITNNLIQKSIREQNQRRDDKFNKLEEKIRTKNGKLVDCNKCNGSGYKACSTCNSNGFSNCNYCNSTGNITCAVCQGSGKSFNATCYSCGGNGSKHCSSCSGKGKKACIDCNALGKQPCQYCLGTGKEFEEDYNQAQTAPINSNNNNDNSNEYSNKSTNYTNAPINRKPSTTKSKNTTDEITKEDAVDFIRKVYLSTSLPDSIYPIESSIISFAQKIDEITLNGCELQISTSSIITHRQDKDGYGGGVDNFKEIWTINLSIAEVNGFKLTCKEEGGIVLKFSFTNSLYPSKINEGVNRNYREKSIIDLVLGTRNESNNFYKTNNYDNRLKKAFEFLIKECSTPPQKDKF